MKTRIGSLAVVVLAAAMLGAASPAPVARDEAAWMQAVNTLSAAKTNRNKQPRAFIDAILGLGEATYSKRDEQTAQILFTLLMDELKDDSPTGAKEDRIDGLVLDACETAFRKVTSKGAIDFIVKMVRAPRSNIRARFIFCRVLGAMKGPETLKVLVDMLEEKDPRLQIGAVDGLREQLKAELSKKVDDLVVQVASGGDQASQILSAAGKALEEQPAALFKQRCDALGFHLENFLMGFGGKEELTKATQEMRAIAEGIAGEEPKRKVVPLVANVSDFVDKFIKSVEELNEARKAAEPATSALLKVIADPKRSWEVRIGAVQALRADRHATMADALIEALNVSTAGDGRIKVDIMMALGAIIGVKDPRTDDPNWWKGALAERRQGKMPGTSGGTTITPTEFFGLKTKSTRIVFILDRTGSMDFRCTESALPPKKDPPRKGPDVPTADEKLPPPEDAAKKRAGDIKKKYDDRKIEKRMDALKREFINTIYHLDPRVHFAVVTYEANPTNWKPNLIQATWNNKLACIQETDRMSPAGGTNIWDGLENAYRFVAEPQRPEVIAFDKKGNYVTTVNGADTFFLMTDGNHNQGRFSGGNDFDERAFLSEFKKINTLRRVVVNTIILGDTTQSADNQDPIKQKSLSLFRQIAEASGGAFVHLGQ